jgi:hypothetical protein
MPTSVATHGSFLKAAAAAPAHLHPKPFFSPPRGFVDGTDPASASRPGLPPPADHHRHDDGGVGPLVLVDDAGRVGERAVRRAAFWHRGDGI